VSNEKNIDEGMITMRIGDKYTNNIVVNNNLTVVDDLKQCDYYFLSIKYTHPIMDSEIHIDLCKGYYCVGNEILSPLFIKRCLEYQHENYHFDKEYELEVMDGNVFSFKLKSDQYIYLNATNYKIMNRNEN
jgi:hypothetical protein